MTVVDAVFIGILVVAISYLAGLVSSIREIGG